MVWPARFRRRIRDSLLAILGVTALGGAAFYALYEPSERPVRLLMTAGQERGTRHRIALVLGRAAANRALSIDLQPMAGSEDALEAMESGRVDAAFVQGGLDTSDHPRLSQVALLHVEPLHLLVKEEFLPAVARGLEGLRGQEVNLGERGSGTHILATEVMAFAGLKAKADYIESTHSYADLERETEKSRLPAAVFTVSTLPSPIARHLVTNHHYRLVSLPFSEAFALGALDENHAVPHPLGKTPTRIDRRRVYDATIPAFAYDVDPAVPPEDIHTLGTRLLLVARNDVPEETIRRLVEVVYTSPFSQFLKPPLDKSLLVESSPEFSWHPGTTEYLRRKSPLIPAEVIDEIEKEVSILGVVAGGLFFLTQWLRRRFRRQRAQSFEAYILQVAQIERQALVLSRAPKLDVAALLQLQDDLTHSKAEALDRFAEGELDGEELMSGFLVHASDTRDFLMRLILHERDNLEDQARAQRRSAEVLWKEAIGEPTDSSVDTRAVNGQDVDPAPTSADRPLAESSQPANDSVRVPTPLTP